MGPCEVDQMGILRFGRAKGREEDRWRSEFDGLTGGAVEAPVEPILKVIPVMVDACAHLNPVAKYRIRKVAGPAHRETAGKGSDGRRDRGITRAVAPQIGTGSGEQS